MNVLLDVLPLDGKLHVREAGEKKEGAPISAKRFSAAEVVGEPAVAVGGHS